MVPRARTQQSVPPEADDQFDSPELSVAEPADSVVLSYEQFTELQRTVQELRSRVETLEMHGRASASTTMPGVHEPELFYGKASSRANEFLIQLRLLFEDSPARFPTERKKILYAVSLFRDKAFQWVEPYLNKDQPPTWMTEFSLFAAELTKRFGNPDIQQNTVVRLRNLRQTSSIATYIAEFQQYANVLQWGDAPLIDYFYQGLKDSIKNELVGRVKPRELNAYIQLVVDIENRFEECAVERTRTPRPTLPHSKNQHQDAQHQAAAPTWSPQYGYAPTAAYDPGPRPRPRSRAASPRPHVQHDTPPITDGIRAQDTKPNRKSQPLTDAQKEYRRINSLCMYCGATGHDADTCSELARKRPTLARIYQASATATAGKRGNHEQQHMVVPILLKCCGISVSTVALIDSGASTSFIDADFALSNSIRLRPKSSPLNVKLADGRPAAGDITHETHLSQLKVGTHVENIQLDVTHLGEYPVILGFSWLQRHDPAVSWSQNKVTFNSAHCREHCLKRPLVVQQQPKHAAPLRTAVIGTLVATQASQPPSQLQQQRLPARTITPPHPAQQCPPT